MNIAQIDNNLQLLVKDFAPKTFVYDLLRAYNTPKSTIKRLQEGGLNLSMVAGEVAWKKQLFFKTVETQELQGLATKDLQGLENLTGRGLKHSPRFVVLTDFERLLAHDTKTTEWLDIALRDLPKHFDFFLPWAGMEKAQIQTENPADVKAAERMARLYDEITKDNRGDTPPTKEEVHNLNVFLSRLLFCFFAEDTGIFDKGIFTHGISSHTQADGSDMHSYLDRLFEVLNTPRTNLTGFENLQGATPAYLLAFPYVNGGLFRHTHHAPKFGRRSRQILIESGELDWSAINPDIFGSMIQAVITPEHRGGLGMHYTSVPNIMKVIEPLFLDDLHQAFAAAKGNDRKLKELLKRLWNIKIFDPACGSGNFLIIAYKELRKLEMAIFKELHEFGFSEISLSHFYGIELDDFAHEIAILSLWLAEHQMNQAFFAEFGRSRPALPLKETGHIVHGNACRVDWEAVCPKNEGDEIYILGNPPYLGSSMQSAEQKADMALVFKGIDGYKNLDYIACWFLKGANFIQNQNAQFAFVSTNSICQGEQVVMLWPPLFKKNLEIGFAHTSFKWVNNAKANAGVTVIIVGLRNDFNKTAKALFIENRKVFVTNINAYLAQGKSIIVEKKSKPISQLPTMDYGTKTVDGGHLTLTFEEKESLIEKNSTTRHFIKKFTGSNEFINDIQRYCLWVDKKEVEAALKIPEIAERVAKVRQMRLASTKEATRQSAETPYMFGEVRHKNTYSIIIPLTTSERRDYIPIGFLQDTIISNSANAIYEAEPWIFSLLTSKIHMVWMRTVAGRLKSDYRYSSQLVYNTFPFPPISDRQKQDLEVGVYRILEEREAHAEKTLAQLYDPDKMPDGLREAHRLNDLAVERCYRSRPFESDEERLEYLFKLYEQMIAEEKSKGTLFEVKKKDKKKK